MVSAIAFVKERKENDEFIPWTYDRLLTWNDFKSPAKMGHRCRCLYQHHAGLAYILKTANWSTRSFATLAKSARGDW